MNTKTRTNTKANVGYLAFILTMLAMMFGLTACVVEAPAETGQTQTQEEPKKDKGKEAKPEQPKETTAQEQARLSAESYLDMGGFSKSGLIEQLEFEGFSTDDARYAVSAVDVNWKDQAVQSAEGYMDLGGFSKESLVDQLVFEGFTQEQAEHAATKVGF